MTAASPAQIEKWLAELGIEPVGSAERDGTNSWDLLLNGRVRQGVPMTLIYDASVGLVCWVHYAPPLADSLRKVYRQMLRWNDELPYIKFALGDDDRPVLSDEVPATGLSRDGVGLTVARLLAVCDLLYTDSAKWVDRIRQAQVDDGQAGARLLERYAAQLAELT